MKTEVICTVDLIKSVWLSLQGNGRLITMRLKSLPGERKKATFEIITEDVFKMPEE